METESLSELVEAPGRGRQYVQALRPGLADSTPSGRVRLDALARWLQDVAYADVEDAGLAQAAVWVVRRTRIQIARFPRFAQRLSLSTFCSGLGRMWAERRTDISLSGGSGPDVRAVSLWVHLDPDTWRPMPFTDQELEVYRDGLLGRRVSARLRHPAPSSIEETRRWRFRATERDLAGHINNAAYWTPLEEELLEGHESGSGDPDRIDAEIEYRTPTQPGEKLVLRSGNRRWIVSDDGETHASLVVVERG